MSSVWKLSPSELTFLWDECPRCFYLKVVHNFKRPWAPFPGIFGRIDKLMKDYYEGKPANEISPELPDGVVRFGEKWVTSQNITFSNLTAACYVKGKFDTVVEFEDGSYGVVDFKTTQPKPEHVPFYSRQLHAYAYALEHPVPGAFALGPISKLGLLCVEPVAMEMSPRGQVAYLGDVTWLECPKDEGQFLAFIENVLSTLENPTPPASGSNCGYCHYRGEARRAGF
jgi:hypothetical protein